MGAILLLCKDHECSHDTSVSLPKWIMSLASASFVVFQESSLGQDVVELSVGSYRMKSICFSLPLGDL